MDRNNPQTSIDAWKSMNGDILAEHYQRILTSLKRLKNGIYEEIAHDAGFTDKNQVSRRLAELERMELVYKTGTKKFTSSKRQANEYALRSENTEVPKPEKIEKGTSAADYANMIIAGTSKGILKQKDLWEHEEK